MRPSINCLHAYRYLLNSIALQGFFVHNFPHEKGSCQVSYLQLQCINHFNIASFYTSVLTEYVSLISFNLVLKSKAIQAYTSTLLTWGSHSPIIYGIIKNSNRIIYWYFNRVSFHDKFQKKAEGPRIDALDMKGLISHPILENLFGKVVPSSFL